MKGSVQLPCQFFDMHLFKTEITFDGIGENDVILILKYSRLSLSRNRRDPQKQFEISVLRHIRFVVLRIKQFEQPIFTNDYVI